MITLGRTRRGSPVYLSDAARALNVQVIGPPGRGKSKFLHSLITQDIQARRGLCLIDPHGTLYDDVVEWCTRANLLRARPIILLDPHIDGWAFGFNALAGDGPIDVHVAATANAIAQVFCGEDTIQMPRLRRVMRAILHCLMANGLTLFEAIELLSANDPQGIRHLLTENLSDPVYAAEWGNLNSLPRREFSERFESTGNRLLEFLAAPIVRAIIGQREMTIDFRKCMDEGAIVLVNLARKDGLSADNARLLGTLIVNDLFQKALTRPPSSRPYYLYIDECYHYLNEDVEAILDQGRKFGLHLILAHQRLGQLRKAGEHIYNAVMAGTQTKVVFGVEDFQDAKQLAEQIFAGGLDLSAAKRAFSRPHVVDYIPEWMRSESDSENKSTSKSGSQGQSHSLGRNRSRGTTLGHSVGHGVSRSQSRSVSQSTNRSATLGESFTRGKSTSVSEGVSKGRSVTHGRSVAVGESDTDGESISEGQVVTRARTTGSYSGTSQGASRGQSYSYDGLTALMPDGRAVSSGASDGETEGSSEAETEAESQSTSRTTSHSRSRSLVETDSHAETDSETITQGLSRSTSESHGENRAVTVGESESEGETATEGESQEARHSEAHTASAGRTEAVGRTQSVTDSRTRGHTRGTGRSQTLRPILAPDRGTPKTLEELFYEAAVRLKNQRPRFAILKMPGKSSVRFRTLDVGVPVASAERTDEFKRRAVAMSLNARPIAEVEREIAARRQELIARATAVVEEPRDFREPAPSSPRKLRPRPPAR